MLSEYIKPLKALAPAADGLAGTKYTDVFSMKDYERITFYVYHDGGTTGKSTFTVQATPLATTSNPTAVVFKYRKMTDGVSDVLGAVTAAEATGIESTPAESTIIEIEVDARDLPEAKPFIHIKAVEGVDDPVNVCVMAFGHSARFKGQTMPSALS